MTGCVCCGTESPCRPRGFWHYKRSARYDHSIYNWNAVVWRM